ncbi:MAG TPA: Flp pilus assembly protein CpaB [Phycisphaerae bacterium]|nr:Flp pilus assembly protein CpaB [Phycisphaerae bacterium]
MKPRSLIPLVIGLVVGFFAIKMGVDMIKRAKGAETDRNVLVSAKQIESATRIEDSMIKPRPVAAGLIPADAFTEPKALVGRVTMMAIPAGVPITKAMLAPPGAEPGLRAKIPGGYRAVSVSVNEESAVAGFLTPGARVDVSAVNQKAGTSKLILTDVEVGAVGQSLSQLGPDGKSVKVTKSVTLFLRPEQVEVLNAHAGNKGTIRLALRGHGDREEESIWAQMFKKDGGTQASSGWGSKSHLVEVVRGSEVERLVFVESSRPGRYKLVEAEGASGGRTQGRNRKDTAGRAITEIGE